MKDKHYLSIPELAKLLGVSRVSIYKKVKSGEIEAIRIGRNYAISVDYVNQYLIDIKAEPLSKEEQERIERNAQRMISEYGDVFIYLGKK